VKVPNATVRLANVVQACGAPEPVTLWVNPRQDEKFQKAVQENRVLTVKQETVGTRKDFGIVGFHRDPMVSYWIFPKPLDAFVNKRVIGIKYDLLKAPELKSARPPAIAAAAPEAGKRPASRPGFERPTPSQPPTPPPPRASRFRVTIRCVSTVDLVQEVECGSMQEARRRALQLASGTKVDFSGGGTQTRRAVRVQRLPASQGPQPEDRRR